MRVCALLVALVLTAGVSSAAAQTSPSFGVKAGANFANLDFSNVDDLDPDQRIGFIGGAFMLFPVTPTFGLQVEALYSQKGAKFEENDTELRYELDTFEVPVLARYTFPSSTNTSFHFFAGPSFGFKLSANEIFEFDDEEEKTDIGDEVAGLDFGLTFGVGIEFGKFVIDGRYTHGFTNLNDSEDDFELGETKSRVFSIMAGFRF